jgi:hypothetical protein
VVKELQVVPPEQVVVQGVKVVELKIAEETESAM